MGGLLSKPAHLGRRSRYCTFEDPCIIPQQQPIPAVEDYYYIGVPTTLTEVLGIPELLQAIFQNFGPEDLAKSRRVCRLWYRVIMLALMDRSSPICRDAEWFIPRCEALSPPPQPSPPLLAAKRYRTNPGYRRGFEEAPLCPGRSVELVAQPAVRRLVLEFYAFGHVYHFQETIGATGGGFVDGCRDAGAGGREPAARRRMRTPWDPDLVVELAFPGGLRLGHLHELMALGPADLQKTVVWPRDRAFESSVGDLSLEAYMNRPVGRDELIVRRMRLLPWTWDLAWMTARRAESSDGMVRVAERYDRYVVSVCKRGWGEDFVETLGKEAACRIFHNIAT